MDDYPDTGTYETDNIEQQGDGVTQAASPSPYPRYRRQTPHVTQAPIDDVEVPYVTRERYQTLEQVQGSGRLHMGTATSDPEYLPSVPNGNDAMGPAHPLSPSNGRRQITHSARYLQTPKPGKSIFTSQAERARKRNHHLILALVVLVIVVAVVAFFILN